ncbi:MAG TPA: DUF4157 domain-containing protein [Pyrinomonadaceae bacterium]|jgi:hypothetical protein
MSSFSQFHAAAPEATAVNRDPSLLPKRPGDGAVGAMSRVAGLCIAPGHRLSGMTIHRAPAVAPQAKLKVSQPGDDFEVEADRVAEQVMSGDSREPQREPGGAPRPTGGNLDSGVRQKMESSFGFDFGQVRVHTGGQAQRAAVALGARAFTTGRDIYFARDQYQPNTSAGRKLLAHELTHVVQQGQAAPAIQRQANEGSAAAEPPAVGGDNVGQVAQEAEAEVRRAHGTLEKALLVADAVLNARELPEETLARVEALAAKARPMLEVARKMANGESPDPGVTFDFDPHRDEVNEGDADLLASRGLDTERATTNSGPAQAYASPAAHGLVNLRLSGSAVQRDGGATVIIIIAIGALLLEGCSKSQPPGGGSGSAPFKPSMKSLTDADGKGWINIKLGDGTVVAQPQHLKVEHTGSSGGRDQFTMKESGKNGLYIDTAASVAQKSGGSSYLASGKTYKGAAKVTFDRTTKQLKYGDKGPVDTFTQDSNPVPEGTHDLEIPDEPHPGGESYESSSTFAKTWFRIGHSGDRFLHPGRVSLGCTTVRGVSEWTSIYNYLIDSRKDTKSVGTLTVT